VRSPMLKRTKCLDVYQGNNITRELFIEYLSSLDVTHKIHNHFSANPSLCTSYQAYLEQEITKFLLSNRPKYKAGIDSLLTMVKLPPINTDEQKNSHLS